MPALTSLLIGTAVVGGLGLGAAGFMQQQSAAKEMKAAQQAEIENQQRIEAQRRQQMELEAARQQKQILRNQQRARSLSLATATAQGAGLGSALPGAYGAESGQANTQSLALAQNLQIGENIFGFNQGVSNARMAYAGAQSDYSAGGALMSLGGALVSNAGTFGRVGATGLKSLQFPV